MSEEDLELEQFKFKLSETLKDLNQVTARVKKKSKIYISRLDSDSDKDDVQRTGLQVATLLEELQKNAVSIIDDLKNNIEEINRDRVQEKLFEDLHLKLVQCKTDIYSDAIKNVEKCDKGINTEDLTVNEDNTTPKVNGHDPTTIGDCSVENEILNSVSQNAETPRFSLSLRSHAVSDAQDTDDDWNDTLKRTDPQDGKFLFTVLLQIRSHQFVSNYVQKRNRLIYCRFFSTFGNGTVCLIKKQIFQS